MEGRIGTKRPVSPNMEMEEKNICVKYCYNVRYKATSICTTNQFMPETKRTGIGHSDYFVAILYPFFYDILRYALRSE